MRTLILAGSYSEAAKYARGVGLKSYRFAVNANAVQNYAAQAIVELPGYESRRDKFALEAVVKRLARRGVERTKDSYTPPAPDPKPFLETLTREDWLLGSVLDMTPAELKDVGASDAEVATFVEIAATAEKVEADLAAEPAPAKPAQKKRVNARKKPEPVENNVSGRDEESVPEATNSSVDDLFED